MDSGQVRLKILIINNNAWSLYNFRAGLIDRLLHEGHRITALVPNKAALHPNLQDKIDCRKIFLRPRSWNPLAELRCWRGLLLNIRRHRPNLILTFTIKPNIAGCFLGKLCGIPVMPNVTGIGRIKHDRSCIGKLVMFVYRKALSVAFWVLFQNKDDAATFINLLPALGHKCTIVPGSGVDPTKYRPLPVKKAEKNRPTAFVFISRLMYAKGVGEFIEAAKMVKAEGNNCEFVLVGPTDEDDSQMFSQGELAERLHNSPVRYVGPSKDVREHLQTADCFVLPSYYPEGLPRSLLEAAAMELPLITTDMPGCREIVDEGRNGFLIKPRSVESLVQAMKKIIEMGPDQRHEFGRTSRQKVVDGFSEQRVVAAYMEKIRLIA